jgi:hypothetical protein
MPMASRWDHLFEARPVPVVEHLLEEVARLLVNELAQWPPPVQEVDLTTASPAFAALLTGEHPRPSPAVVAGGADARARRGHGRAPQAAPAAALSGPRGAQAPGRRASSLSAVSFRTELRGSMRRTTARTRPEA